MAGRIAADVAGAIREHAFATARVACNSPLPTRHGAPAALRRVQHATERCLEGGRLRQWVSTLRKLTVRYARWDLSCVELYDARTGIAQCRVYPIDKAANADRRRRHIDPIATSTPSLPASPAGIAPYLRELLERYAATGLPPGYLPTVIPALEPTHDPEPSR